VSLQFSRSLRALQIDSFRASRIGLLLAILLMFVLILWFFLAKVTLYEDSESLSITQEGRIVGIFNPESIKRIHPGQPALLRVEAEPDQPKINLPVLVIDLDLSKESVEFLIMTPELEDLNLINGEIEGQISVEVAYITPAQLLLRSTGKYFNGNNVPLSPQTYEDLK